jgi:HPt (histidine-containing phosphotransfer) domain-containing protein
LKGSLATIGAQAARRTAANMERLGRAGSLDDVRPLYAELREQLRALDRMLLTVGLVGTSRAKATERRPKRPRKSARRSGS